ncbi:MAG TPA: MerR family transcriptional regulator [Polyangiaceae bacterium]|nr:MerR family transcriptional regulator [Polyangiaceae bacterium]
MPREKGDRPVKLYYRIGEAAGLIGVEPHVLRYWESEFPTIRPQKARSGQRVYSRRDVEKLLRVKELLYSQRFTIAGARQRLREIAADPEEAAAPMLERSTELAEPVRAGTESLRNTLMTIREQVVSLLEQLEHCGSKPSSKQP